MLELLDAEAIEKQGAESLLDTILGNYAKSPACLTCSFQAEDMIVLSLLRNRLPKVPVLFLETGYHFSDTYRFRDQIVAEWRLNLVNVIPRKTVQQQESEFGILYREDPAKCCQLRKVEPLMESLEPFEIWFTGLRREQSPTRKNLKKVEQHRLPSGKTLLKVSLLADWTWAQVWEYTGKHSLSYLPQYDQGYFSIGCEPCTELLTRSGEPALRPLERKETRMRNPHVFGACGMIHVALGFFIALIVGLTGIGGGSFTVPALLLIVGLPAGEAVGTAFVFAGVLRLIAAPFYLASRQVHSRYFRLLVVGAVPGLVLGIIALRFLAKPGSSPVVVIILGLLLALTSSVTFMPRVRNPGFAVKNTRWLPWLAFPIGVESGFSSAGAGALGTVLLLNYSEMAPAQVVGTDILFGLVLAVIGSLAHWTFGSISTSTLLQFLEGGVPGVVLGCLLARKVPAQRLKAVVAVVALAVGLQLVWSGVRALKIEQSSAIAKLAAQLSGSSRP